MSYILTPELKKALGALPFFQRTMTRLRLHLELAKLARIESEMDHLKEAYDCGPDLLNHLTYNRWDDCEGRYEAQAERVREITEPLLSEEGGVQ